MVLAAGTDLEHAQRCQACFFLDCQIDPLMRRGRCKEKVDVWSGCVTPLCRPESVPRSRRSGAQRLHEPRVEAVDVGSESSIGCPMQPGKPAVGRMDGSALWFEAAGCADAPAHCTRTAIAANAGVRIRMELFGVSSRARINFRYRAATSGIFPIRCHSRGPVWWTDVPFASTATVTGISFTRNS